MDQLQNTSGQGKDAVVPEAIRHWNWGAFVFGAIWVLGNGIGDRSQEVISSEGYVRWVLLYNFSLGSRGNELAWRYKHWNNTEEFRRIQRMWSLAGFVFVVILLGLLAYILNHISQ